jgi:hypothetical protein
MRDDVLQCTGYATHCDRRASARWKVASVDDFEYEVPFICNKSSNHALHLCDVMVDLDATC